MNILHEHVIARRKGNERHYLSDDLRATAGSYFIEMQHPRVCRKSLAIWDEMLVMKKENLALFNEVLSMMRNDDYIINSPINPGFLDKITHKQKETAVLSPELKIITNDISLFLTAQPDYVDLLNTMDGFAYNGLILYSFSIKSEDGLAPSNNIFLNNDNFRHNDIYVSPCLAKNIVIGQDSISFFTYDLKENKYQIRDNVAIETVYDTFDNFADFLA